MLLYVFLAVAMDVQRKQFQKTTKNPNYFFGGLAEGRSSSPFSPSGSQRPAATSHVLGFGTNHACQLFQEAFLRTTLLKNNQDLCSFCLIGTSSRTKSDENHPKQVIICTTFEGRAVRKIAFALKLLSWLFLLLVVNALVCVSCTCHGCAKEANSKNN